MPTLFKFLSIKSKICKIYLLFNYMKFSNIIVKLYFINNKNIKNNSSTIIKILLIIQNLLSISPSLFILKNTSMT